MNINIYGSTGTIGLKTLEVVEHNFSNIKVNLLCAKSNIKLLKKQIHKFKPKYAFLNDHYKFPSFSGKIDDTYILNFKELKNYLLSSRSDYSVLAISGYKSLYNSSDCPILAPRSIK